VADELKAFNRLKDGQGPSTKKSRLFGRFLVWPASPFLKHSTEYVKLRPIRDEVGLLRSITKRFLLLAIAFFLIWATFAPIDRGINVSGTVIVWGNRKIIQHPSGGVVEEIFVKEGSVVRIGDPLLRINRLSTLSELEAAEIEYIDTLTIESRLISEREDLDEIRWSTELFARSNERKVIEAKYQQSRLFQSRKAEVSGQIRIIEEQIKGTTLQLNELHKVLSERRQQIEITTQEAHNAITLAEEGYLAKMTAHDLDRRRRDLIASIATTEAEIAKARSDIVGARLQISQVLAVDQREVESQLAEIKKSKDALRTKVESLKFQFDLTELRAPVGGIIVGLKVHTVGGVIQSGAVLMEIAPDEGKLIVEAQIPPNLIDKVVMNLDADLRFNAFNLNTTPVISGKVSLVGADLITGTRKNELPEFYKAHIETTYDGQRLLGERIVQAGMPVDVVIKTGERSFMSHILKPLSDHFARSFKDN
jgi:protease secretion system membrane fusion protein